MAMLKFISLALLLSTLPLTTKAVPRPRLPETPASSKTDLSRIQNLMDQQFLGLPNAHNVEQVVIKKDGHMVHWRGGIPARRVPTNPSAIWSMAVEKEKIPAVEIVVFPQVRQVLIKLDPTKTYTQQELHSYVEKTNQYTATFKVTHFQKGDVMIPARANVPSLIPSTSKLAENFTTLGADLGAPKFTTRQAASRKMKTEIARFIGNSYPAEGAMATLAGQLSKIFAASPNAETRDRVKRLYIYAKKIAVYKDPFFLPPALQFPKTK